MPLACIAARVSLRPDTLAQTAQFGLLYPCRWGGHASTTIMDAIVVQKSSLTPRYGIINPISRLTRLSYMRSAISCSIAKIGQSRVNEALKNSKNTHI